VIHNLFGYLRRGGMDIKKWSPNLEFYRSIPRGGPIHKFELKKILFLGPEMG
jgi:hypothetical protein